MQSEVKYHISHSLIVINGKIHLIIIIPLPTMNVDAI